MVNMKIIKDGAKAIENTHKRWETDWIPIGLGLIELRKQAIEDTGGAALKSSAYNEAFGRLLLKHKYDADLLEKNTRTALLNLFTMPDALARLNQLRETHTPATRAGLTPRVAWDLVKGPAKAKKQKDPNKGPSLDDDDAGTPPRAELEERLANAEEALAKAIVLDEATQARLEELWNKEEFRPKLVALAQAINSLSAKTTPRKARKPKAVEAPEAF